VCIFVCNCKESMIIVVFNRDSGRLGGSVKSGEVPPIPDCRITTLHAMQHDPCPLYWMTRGNSVHNRAYIMG